MGRFVARRLIQSALLVLAVMTFSFFLIHLTPGGPETALMQNPRVSAETLQRMRQRFGLDDPLPIHYLKWLQSARRARLRTLVRLLAARSPTSSRRGSGRRFSSTALAT